MRVARIDAEAGSSLERLGAAVAVADELRELGDLVVDRYVRAARADQRSWSQIGEVLGVTKQAAQQRFVAQPMQTAPWPGLSEAASGVVGRAVDEARLRHHRYLGTEHLLLALASDDGLAGSALQRLGVSPEGVTEQIQRIIGPGHSADSATLGVTPRTKRVLEAARKEARRLGHRCADAEQLLLEVSEMEGAAEQMLREAGPSPATCAHNSRRCSRTRHPRSRPSCARRHAAGCSARELDPPVAGRRPQAYHRARARLTLERRHPSHPPRAQSVARDGFARAPNADLPRRRRASAPFPDHYRKPNPLGRRQT